MPSATFEKIRDDQQTLQFESLVSSYVPIVGGGNTRMPFDDTLNGNAFVELDKNTGTITLELYKGLPISDPTQCGYRQTWRA